MMPTEAAEFLEAFWALVIPRQPLRYGRATIHVSPEDARHLPTSDAVLASVIDPRLRHLEMRLEVRP